MDKIQQSREAVSQKILATARETERLKQELEALIASGIRGRAPPLSASSSKLNSLESTNRVQIIKSYDAKHSQHIKRNADLLGSTSEVKLEEQGNSPKKPKTYDVEEARKYIKKQRGKHKQELQLQKTDTQHVTQKRKEKLLELQQKANEIVKRNVEAKRARSKSRDPPIFRSRSVSKELQFTQRSPSKEKKTLGQDNSIIQGFNRAKKTTKIIPEPLGLPIANDQPPVSNQNLLHSQRKAVSMDNIHANDKDSQKRYQVKAKKGELQNYKKPTNNPNLLHPPEPSYGVLKNLNEDQLDTDIKCVDNNDKNQPLKKDPCKLEHTELFTNKSTSSKEISLKPCLDKQSKPKTQSAVNVLSNITLRPSVEDDQRLFKQTPDWLKEQPQSDPYNFINTVKRKLQYVVTEKKPFSVDVGVQGNLDDMNSNASSSKSSKKTDLKSFLSHKCGNLDSKIIENIEANRPKTLTGSCRDGATINYSGDDSDTSKNIPSISSESCSSLKRNAEIVKQSYQISDLKPMEDAPPNLDFQKIEGVKLDSHSVKNLVSEENKKPSPPLEKDIVKVKKQLFKDSDAYSSDFVHTDLSKSRESIISFNRPLSSNRAAKSASSICSSLGSEQNLYPHLQSNNQKSEGCYTEGDNSKAGLSNTASNTIQTTELKNPIQNNKTKSLQQLKSPLPFDKSDLLPTQSISEAIVTSKNLSNFSYSNSEEHKNKGAIDSHQSNPENDLLKSISEAVQPLRSQELLSAEKYAMKSLSKSEPNLQSRKKNKSILPLNITTRNKDDKFSKPQTMVKNITVRPSDKTRKNKNENNVLHLKFEAEIHLLTDFNQTIQRFSEIEKTFESLRHDNNSKHVENTIRYHKDTQTSETFADSNHRSKTSKEKPQIVSSEAINFSSADLHMTKLSDIQSDIWLDLTQASDINSSLAPSHDDTMLDLTSDRAGSITNISSKGKEENNVFTRFVGMSLKVFDQLIKDEDARIENWKKLLKIREQALLDRTRGELVYLEMQRKQLIETGKLAEASMIKKKQRGIILKHQQERHEMQRLKQMQKEGSHTRKALLKQEKSQVKNELLSGNMLSKLKLSHRERNDKRHSGPFKVIQTTGSRVHSETSLSKNGSSEEIKSITTRTSRTRSVINVMSATTDNFDTDLELAFKDKGNISSGAISNIKKTLLMREHALAKRRKTVEELLQWYKKLLKEEKAIETLENKIGTIISKVPSQDKETTPRKSKTQSSHASNNTSNDEISSHFSMSQLVLEKIWPLSDGNVSRTSKATSEQTKNIPQDVTSDNSNTAISSANYTADFDAESANRNSDDEGSVSSISQLIENFSKIEGNILNISFSKRHIDNHEASEANQVESESEASVIIVEEPDEHINLQACRAKKKLKIDKEQIEDTTCSEAITEDLTDEKEKLENSVIIVEDDCEELCTSSHFSSSEQIQQVFSEGGDGDEFPSIVNNLLNISNERSLEPQQTVEENSCEEIKNKITATSDIQNDSNSEKSSTTTQTNTEVKIDSINTDTAYQPDTNDNRLNGSLSTPLNTSLEHNNSCQYSDSFVRSFAENIEEHVHTSNQQNDDTTNIPELKVQHYSDESGSPSKEDISTSKQYDEIDDFVVSNFEHPSTSRQSPASPILSLSGQSNEREDEDGLPNSLLHHETDRQLFENKTDEEKAASLSGRGRLRLTSVDDIRLNSSSSSHVNSISNTTSLDAKNFTQLSKADSSSKPLSELKSVISEAKSEVPVASSNRDLRADSIDQVASVDDNSSTIDNLSGSSLPTEISKGSDHKTFLSEDKSVTALSKNEDIKSTITDNKSVSINLKKDSSESSESGSVSVENKSSVIESSKSSEPPTITSQKSSEKSVLPQKTPISTSSKSSADIKKHVQDILSVSSPISRGDRSPRMQDLCLMTYDTSPIASPESASPLDEKRPFSLGSEAEELHRKQLAIEQEIKLLKEQQQKEAPSPFYVREIPNKPPPPYTPPSKSTPSKIPSVIPSSKEEVEQIIEYSAKIIYKSYLSNNLDNITISDNTLNLIAKNVDKGCYKYIFDFCKEIAKDHYGQFVNETGPCWLKPDTKPVLAKAKPFDVVGLKKYMSKNVLEVLGFVKPAAKRENAIMKWSRKKRDHVDEVLVQEMQVEDVTWTNFNKDEALVKDRITNELMEMLLRDTSQVLKKTLQKKLNVTNQ